MDIHNVTINGCSFNSGWDLIDYGGGHPDVNLEFNFLITYTKITVVT